MNEGVAKEGKRVLGHIKGVTEQAKEEIGSMLFIAVI